MSDVLKGEMMSVDERARHQLYNKAVEVFGEEEAEILMAHLPPGGWPNLATKQDMLALKQELGSLREEFRRDMTGLEGRLTAEIVGDLKAYMWRAILVANLGMAAAFATIAFTAAGLR